MQFSLPKTRRLSLKGILSLWLPPLLWMGFIFYLSGRPGLKVAEGTADFLSRKLAHIGEYAALYLLLLRALKRSFSWEASLPLFLVAGTFSFLYAVSDELHQSFVPLREGKVGDLFFDLLGILAGFLAVRFGLLKCLGFGE